MEVVLEVEVEVEVEVGLEVEVKAVSDADAGLQASCCFVFSHDVRREGGVLKV